MMPVTTDGCFNIRWNGLNIFTIKCGRNTLMQYSMTPALFSYSPEKKPKVVF